MLLEIVLVLVVLALWDYGRRRLLNHASRHDQLLIVAQGYAEQVRQLEVELDAQSEYMRSVLAGFLSSMTAIVSLSVEEKRHLENRLSRENIGRAKGL